LIQSRGHAVQRALLNTPVSRERPLALAAFRNTHQGATIVVCGCGASLKELVNPGHYVTIGVNDVGRLFDPTYLVVVNPRTQFKNDRFRYVEQSNAQALFTQLDLGRVRPPVVRFRLGSYGGTEIGADVLPHTQNSPYVAVCLAAYMGASLIGLIGVDLTDDHFFARTGRHPLAGRLGEIDAQYARLAAALQRRGVTLVNLSATSRLTSLPKTSIDRLADTSHPPSPAGSGPQQLHVVSYATTPVAGVPAILARCIAGATEHSARCVWAADGYGNGVRFVGDVEWQRTPREAMDLLEAADIIIVHNGKVAPPHLRLLDAKPVVTMAHNYGWNVDTRFVQRGHPGVVVGQYQATLPEFAQWAVVPNPIPLWEPTYCPGPKADQITIAFTPSGRHECYPPGHRLYWHGKGFTTTMRVLERLARRSGVRLETTAQHQVSHEQSLAMKRRAHIVIDECVTGSYHRNSLEGLATGCVVVNGVGSLPGVREALLRCAGDYPDDLFVSATLENLEAKLDDLVGLGADVLWERGVKGRSWVESHWNFKNQWDTHWRPVVEQALNRSQAGTRHPGIQPASPPAQNHAETRPQRASSLGLSVVIPFRGVERLDLLATTVAGLHQSTAVQQVIIVELGDQPVAIDVARRWGTDYLFAPSKGLFDKARALNLGTTLARHVDIVWCDGDLLFPPGFMARAHEEFQNRGLDFFFPFSRVQYLGQIESTEVRKGTRPPEDCRALRSRHPMRGGAVGGVGFVRTDLLRRFGGMLEGFLGWGGEDNAWLHKALLVGRVGATSRQDQVTYHLFHPENGASGAQPWRNNPHYQHNVALLAEVQRMRTASQLLRRFPALPHWPTPWAAAKRVCFIVLAGNERESATVLAEAWASRVHALYGISIRVVTVPPVKLGDTLRTQEADASVVFVGDGVCLADPTIARLLSRAIIVLGDGASGEDCDAGFADSAFMLAYDSKQIESLRSRGRRVWHVTWGEPSNDQAFAAPVVVQPLSVLLGAQQPAVVEQVQETRNGASGTPIPAAEPCANQPTGAGTRGYALVAAASGIGDVIRTTPLIRVLHQMGYAVDVLLAADYPETGTLLVGAPEIRRVITYPYLLHNRGRRTCTELVGVEYDLACFSYFAQPLEAHVRAKQRLRFDRTVWQHEGDSSCVARLARDVGWAGPLPTPFVVAAERRFDLPRDTIALHAGCKKGWPWKKWHGFVDLAERLEHVALIGTAEDHDVAGTYFGRELKWPGHARNYIGRLTLPETAALIQQCAALVCNDSGMQHIGAAVGTPTYPVFGITSPAREIIPLAHVHPVTKGLTCEPACRLQPWGRRDCHRHLECLKTMTATEVLDRLKRDAILPPSAETVCQNPRDTSPTVPAETLMVAVRVDGGIGDVLLASPLLEALFDELQRCEIDVFYHRPEAAAFVFARARFVRAVHATSQLASHERDYDLSIRTLQFVRYTVRDPAKLERVCPGFTERLREVAQRFEQVRGLADRQPALDGLWGRISVRAGRGVLDNIGFLGGVGVTRDSELFLAPDPAAHRALEATVGDYGRYVTLHDGFDNAVSISAGAATKCWPLEHWERLTAGLKARSPGLRLVQVGAKKSRRIPGVDVSLVDRTSLHEAAWIIKHSQLHVDTDSGLVHVARALHTPAVVLFGPTDPGYFGHACNTNIAATACANCWWSTPDWLARCPRGLARPECMESITPDVVLAHIVQRLAGTRAATADAGPVTCYDGDLCHTDRATLVRMCGALDLPLLPVSQHIKNDRTGVYIHASKQWEYLYALRALADAFEAKRSGLRIADLGGGRGALAPYLACEGHRVEVFDTDYLWDHGGDRAVELRYRHWAKRMGYRAAFGSLHNVPAPSDSFDAITCISVVEHLPYKEYALKEALRILRPGGVLILTFDFANAPERFEDGMRCEILSPERLARMLHRLGIAVAAPAHEEVERSARRIQADGVCGIPLGMTVAGIAIRKTGAATS
jgi:ADP-heptose:LPS heptosyltransferase/SAM-dependent methyltransferase